MSDHIYRLRLPNGDYVPEPRQLDCVLEGTAVHVNGQCYRIGRYEAGGFEGVAGTLKLLPWAPNPF